MPVTPPILQVSNIEVVYEKVILAVHGVSLQVEEGQVVALLGANGAGKSTLLQHLNGLLPAASGEVLVDGLRVEADSLVQVRQRVGYVFQQAEDQLFMPTVADDVAFGPRNLGLSAAEVEERVQQALQAVGAQHLAPRAPWRLSGGEQRAVGDQADQLARPIGDGQVAHLGLAHRPLGVGQRVAHVQGDHGGGHQVLHQQCSRHGTALTSEARATGRRAPIAAIDRAAKRSPGRSGARAACAAQGDRAGAQPAGDGGTARTSSPPKRST